MRKLILATAILAAGLRSPRPPRRRAAHRQPRRPAARPPAAIASTTASTGAATASTTGSTAAPSAPEDLGHERRARTPRSPGRPHRAAPRPPGRRASRTASTGRGDRIDRRRGGSADRRRARTTSRPLPVVAGERVGDEAQAALLALARETSCRAAASPRPSARFGTSARASTRAKPSSLEGVGDHRARRLAGEAAAPARRRERVEQLGLRSRARSGRARSCRSAGPSRASRSAKWPKPSAAKLAALVAITPSTVARSITRSSQRKRRTSGSVQSRCSASRSAGCDRRQPEPLRPELERHGSMGRAALPDPVPCSGCGGGIAYGNPDRRSLARRAS